MEPILRCKAKLKQISYVLDKGLTDRGQPVYGQVQLEVTPTKLVPGATFTIQITDPDVFEKLCDRRREVYVDFTPAME